MSSVALPTVTNNKQTNKQKQIKKQTNKQTDRQTDRQTSKQTNKQTDKQTNKQTNKQTDKETDRRPKNAIFAFAELRNSRLVSLICLVSVKANLSKILQVLALTSLQVN